jgi:phage terminase large subunit-like protein
MAAAVKKTAPPKVVARKVPAKKVAGNPKKTPAARRPRDREAVDIGQQAPLKLVRPTWTTACPDWQERIVNDQTMTPCAPLFPTAAAKGMAIFDELNIVDAGIKFGQCRPWFREFAEQLYGAYCDVPGHPDEGRRLIRTFFMLIPKKNAKSTLAAGIMLTAILLNWRPEAEYIILSPTKEVAENSWKPLLAAIESDDELSAKFKIQKAQKIVTHIGTNSTLKVVAADSATVVGKKATGVFVDELHEFGKVAKAEDMLLEATGGLMSRPEGFVIYATTQSSEPPAGVFKKELSYARKVRDGAANDPTYLPIIYEFPDSYLAKPAKLYTLPQNWHIVNPNLGATVDVEILTQKISKAGQDGEDSIQGVYSKHLNVQIGLDLGADAWPAAQLWEENRHSYVRTLKELQEVSEVVTAGIDGGGLDDLLALTFVGRLKKGHESQPDRYVSWSHCWANEIVLKRRPEIADRLRDFEREGHLTIPTVIGEDVKQLAELVKGVHATDLLAGVGIDPARIASLLTALEDAGIPTHDTEFVVKVRQGWSLYSAMLWMERALGEGRFYHAGQPIVDWAVGNAKVIPRGNAMLVTKEISGKAKIDPVMSNFNASELMSHNPASRTGGYSLDKLTMMG